jgi:hypothetical protein
MDLSFVKYNPKYDQALNQLEQAIVQGKTLRMKIIKKHFLDRAKVFKKYHALLAVDKKDNPVATCIGAATKLRINGTTFNAGIGYDVKVSMPYRNNGVAKRLGKRMYQQFFIPEGLTRNFVTLKQSNIPVIRLLSKTVFNIYLYDFVYLTIPCTTEIKRVSIVQGDKPLFSVTLFKEDEPDPSLYSITKSGLGYFNTYKVYQLQIAGIGIIYRVGLWLLKKFNPQKYSQLPAVGETIKFATLFDHTPENINHISEVLEELEQKGVNYLLVCCRRKDGLYNTLKKISVNTYGYYILSDFLLDKQDSVAIDVRCL